LHSGGPWRPAETKTHGLGGVGQPAGLADYLVFTPRRLRTTYLAAGLPTQLPQGFG